MMKKNDYIDLRIGGYTVRHIVRTGKNCILCCTCDDRKYAEIIIENMEDLENGELLCGHRMKFGESVPKRKDRRKYTLFYQDTRQPTHILAGNIKIYYSSCFIQEAGRYAIAQWKERHICLPSVMTGILMLEKDNEDTCIADVRESVRRHTDYLASCLTESEPYNRWQQENYILAAQYLYMAVPPFHRRQDFETLLIQVIEDNQLTRFDLQG